MTFPSPSSSLRIPPRPRKPGAQPPRWPAVVRRVLVALHLRAPEPTTFQRCLAVHLHHAAERSAMR
jgi:hypothetical protein